MTRLIVNKVILAIIFLGLGHIVIVSLDHLISWEHDREFPRSAKVRS